MGLLSLKTAKWQVSKSNSHHYLINKSLIPWTRPAATPATFLSFKIWFVIFGRWKIPTDPSNQKQFWYDRAELFFKLTFTWISLFVLPNFARQSLCYLLNFVPPKHIPYILGGRTGWQGVGSFFRNFIPLVYREFWCFKRRLENNPQFSFIYSWW